MQQKDHMEDKRQLANQELQNSLDSGILSFVPPSQESFKIPDAPKFENTNSEGNVTNNFNVNVNVNGGQNTTKLIQTATSNAIQKALPNVAGSPEDIKKNSSIGFQTTSNLELKGFDSPILQQPDILKSMVHLYSNTDKSATNLFFSNLSDFQNPSISHYTYGSNQNTNELKSTSETINQYDNTRNIIDQSSVSQPLPNISPAGYVFNNNTENANTINEKYEILKNAIYPPNQISNTSSNYTIENTIKSENRFYDRKSTVLNNIVNDATASQNNFNTSLYESDPSLHISQYLDRKTNNISQNLNIENNMNSYQMLNQLSDRRERYEQKSMNEMNKTIRSIESMANINDNEIDDVADSRRISPPRGAGPSFPDIGYDNAPLTHINGNTKNNIPEFIAKMNRPPIWRSVLG